MSCAMDPHSFNIHSAHELRLRRHIRDVLLSYARTHLTSDHVTFTERAVEELLLQTLECVPMADAMSFHLPTEPFDVLMRPLHSLHLTPPEEKWVTPAGHVRYLRTFFPPPTDLQDLPTEKYWHEEDPYVKLSLTCKPISSPVLSNRARRETPKPRNSTYRAFIPLTNSALITFCGLTTLSAPSVEDLPTPPVDDVLDLRLELNSAIGTRSQLVPVSSVTETPANYFGDASSVPEFLNHKSPPRRLPSLDSPPLFPRVPQGCPTLGGYGNIGKNGVGNTTRVPDLVSMLRAVSPQSTDYEDGDISSHHMRVVSGQSTLSFSSPPLLPLPSSDVSEIDGLWHISPPGTPATSLVAAKMDEVEIPRIRKFGHKNTLADACTNRNSTADLLTVAKSPGFFITSFISAPIPLAQVHESITSQLESVNSGMHPPRPLSPGQSTSDSLLGKPPSIPEVQDGEKTMTSLEHGIFIDDFEEERFDDAVASIYVSTPQDPLDYIREEKLDDKNAMLMDVPVLPPPTAHPKTPVFFPDRIQAFVVPKGEPCRFDIDSHKATNLGDLAFLCPVKGIKPLALDLSWRPFSFGKAIPTDEEVSGVAKAIQPEDEIPGYRDEKYEKATQVLLDLATLPILTEEAQKTLIPNIPRGCEEFGTSPASRRTEESGHIAYLLTQRERLRASCAKTMLDAEVEIQDGVDFAQQTVPWPHNDGHANVLARGEYISQDEEHPDLSDVAQYCSRGDGYPFDDSGIDILDDNIAQFFAGEPTPSHSHLYPFQDDSPCVVDTLGVRTENTSENEENVPPQEVDGDQPLDGQLECLAKHYDWSNYFEFPDSDVSPSFEPLSLVLQNRLPTPQPDFEASAVRGVFPPSLSDPCISYLEDGLVSTKEHEQPNSRATKRRRLDDLVPASSRDLFSTFIQLRNQVPTGRTIEYAETGDDTPTLHQTPNVREQIPPRAAPDDVFDQRTVRLPEHWMPAAAVHRYLVSMSLIQKRALVHELQGHQCRVVLVERYNLGGTDVITDPDHGVLFIPLLALPANIDSALERISGESWRYSNLLIIFEAFPSAQSYRVHHLPVATSVPYAYTPPICKAIKKLRRNLGIAEGCGTKNAGCKVTWAFANDTEEAAKFVRCFGEEACAISTERGHGVLWDDREWLEEEREGESDLARVHGMNAFAAFVMLYDRSLDAILDLSPEVRLAEYGPLLGRGRVMGLNGVIDSSLQEIVPDITDAVTNPES